ncbi:MAG: cadherin-like domain-containing protein [Planctomycetota bacterium]
MIDDGSVAYTIQTGVITAPGETTGYNTALDPPDVSLTNVDNDSAGVTVTPSGGFTLLTEAGTTDTYTVVLNTQPTSGVVVINLLPDSQVTTGVAGGQLFFAAASAGTGDALTLANRRIWNSALTVTATAVNDLVDEGVHSGVVSHQIDAATTASEFIGASVASLSAVIIDNDTAGVTVTPTSGLTVTEAGSTTTFTVVLNTQPTDTVTIGLSSTDPTEGTVSPASLSFTVANWNTAQTVTITGVNDDIDDGNVAFTITTAAASSTDTNYNAMNPSDAAASCTDDDTAAVVVAESGGATTASEGGAGDSYTVRLATEPLASVTVTITPDAQVTTAPPTLTFTTGNWMTPQTVTVAAVDDIVSEGAHTGTITHAVTTADGGAYALALSCPSVSAGLTDNDTAAVTLSTNAVSVTEGGATDSYTICLATQPTGVVTITATVGSQLSLPSASSVYFAAAAAGSGDGSTSGNASLWSNPVSVTVAAADDSVVEGTHTATVSMSASGGGYAAVVITSVTATITDNDTPGVTVTPTSGLNVTESGGQAFFGVRLNSQPTATVTVALSLSAPDSAEISISPVSLSFTTADWDQVQLVTITGLNDSVADGNYIATVATDAAVSADGYYSGLDAADVSVTNVDNDVRGVTITQSGGSTAVTEGGATDTYTIVLDSQPTATVAVSLLSDGQVTATGSGGGSVVYFGPTATGTTDGSSAGNRTAWNNAITVTVTAVDDAVSEANPHTGSIAHGVGGGDYAGLTVSSVTVSITDNDAAGITIGTISHPVTETGMALIGPLSAVTSQSISTTAIQFPAATDLSAVSSGLWISLAAGPNAGVYARISAVDDANDRIDLADPLTADATARAVSFHSPFLSTTAISGTTVTFSAGVPLTSLQVGQYLKFVSGPNDGTTTQIAAVNDAGHTITTTTPLTATGGSDLIIFVSSVTVVLTSQPTAVVTVPLHSGDTTIANLFPASVSFTPANWNIPQSIGIVGVNNDIDDGDQSFAVVVDAAFSLDANYNGLAGSSATGLRLDDDARGVTVGTPSGATTELGGTATFTIVLTSQPTATVVIPVSSSDTAQASVSTASLVFTTANWNDAQTVTVTGLDGDSTDNGAGVAYNVVLGAVTGSSDYLGLDPADVAMTNLGANNQPNADAIANATILEDATPLTVTVTGIDVGQTGEVQTLTVTATSSAPGVVPSPTVTYPGSGGSTTADVVITPVADASGVATVTVTVTDSGGTANGGIDTRTRTFSVTVTSVNDLPVIDLNGVVAGTGFTSTFTEGGGAVTIVDPTPTVSDVDNTTLAAAYATFSTGAPADGTAETLSVVTAGTLISATYNSATGILSMTTSTPQPLSDFQTVLATLSYNNTSGTPTTTNRLVQVTLYDGAATSVAAVATVQVVDVQFAPVVDLNGPVAGIDHAATFTEGGSAVDLGTSLLDVSDPDSSTISGAVATITNIQDGVAESLSIDVGVSGLTATWTTPTVTITGTASTGTYAAVLRSLSYTHSSDTPTAGARTIQITVNDGTGNTSAVATSTITVVAVNDVPTLSTNGFTITLGSSYVLSAAEMLAADVETANPALLVFVVDLIPGQGTLSRSGVPLAIHDTFTQADLNAGFVIYQHTAPVSGLDGFAVRVTDPSAGSSPLQPVPITINGLSPPVVTFNGPALAINEEDAATVIDNDAGTSITDADSPTLNGGNVTVTFGGSAHVGDVLTVPGVTAGGTVTIGGVAIGSVDGTNDGNGGRPLVVSFLSDGSPTLSRVSTLLRSLTYRTTADIPPFGARTLSVTASDGSNTSAAGTTTITITAFDDAPRFTVPAVPFAIVPGISRDGQIVAVDPEGQPLTYTVVAAPSQGTLSLNAATGAFTYTALAAATATDSFTVQADDGTKTTSQAYAVHITQIGEAAPIITTPAPMVVWGGLGLFYTPTVTTAGLTSPSLLFELQGTLTGAVFNTTSGAINWGAPPSPGASGYYQAGILVIDQISGSACYQPLLLLWMPGVPL